MLLTRIQEFLRECDDNRSKAKRSLNKSSSANHWWSSYRHGRDIFYCMYSKLVNLLRNYLLRLVFLCLARVTFMRFKFSNSNFFFKISLRLVSISIHHLMIFIGSVGNDIMTRIVSESRDNLVCVSSSQETYVLNI